MRYMLLIYEDETLWERITDKEKGAIYQEVGEFIEGLRKSGVCQPALRRSRPAPPPTVRMNNGKTVTTDGPFAETKEQFGGYNIVEAENLDEPISIAARHPGCGWAATRSRCGPSGSGRRGSQHCLDIAGVIVPAPSWEDEKLMTILAAFVLATLSQEGSRP